MKIIDVDALVEHVAAHVIKLHFEHCMRTAETAHNMAINYHQDEQKAYIAGLLHDYTKSMSTDDILEQSHDFGIVQYPCEEAIPYLLHAKLAARLVERDLGITDIEILNAIERHTVGAVNMSALDKIVYVADMIEPGRPYARVDELRHIALNDLDAVFKLTYEFTVDFLVSTRKAIHPVTVEVWNYLVLS